MGRERTGPGKRLLFFIALCIGFCGGMTGCGGFHGGWLHSSHEKAKSSLADGKARLARAEALRAKKDFEASLKEAQSVLRDHFTALGDRALFLIGAVAGNPDNPGHDYAASLKAFHKLATGFPASKMRPKATLAAHYVKGLMRQEHTIEKLRAEKTRLKNGLDKCKDRDRALQKELDESRAEIKSLKDQLEKLKQIDLVIEEKKKQVK